MRFCVIFNPKARGERASHLEDDLRQLGQDYVVKRTSGPGAARLLAAEAVSDGFETVVAAGGDGTINEVVNGIGDVAEGFARARLGVLPIGTVNVFARELGIPQGFAAAMKFVLGGKEISIDLPGMRFQRDGSSEERYFIQMAGAGLDARAIEIVDLDLKKRIGQLAYVIAGLKALRQPAPEIRVGGDSQTFKAQLVLIGNGRYYGGKIPIFSRGDSQDGLLDIRIFKHVNWFVLARYLLGFLSPRLYYPIGEAYLQTASVKLDSAERVPVELDGEWVGCLPAECFVRARALRVIVP
ncbi:MAG: diacylglycerol kinase family lipid kinase [Verrucomicrobia bacterium]|nr:diacylglycerol kinase family lipid kinase [Verrucomicrobiota bacterium]